MILILIMLMAGTTILAASLDTFVIAITLDLETELSTANVYCR